MEIWKDIPGYKGLYQVSNLGSVKRLNKNNEKILKNRIRDGYFAVSLSKNGIRKDGKISRMVAIAFVDNPFNYNIVNHIDGNKQNNNYENLEWVSNRENIHHYHLSKNATTKHSCIYDKKYGFVVQVSFEGKRHYLGYYKNLNNAIEARNCFLKSNNIVNKYI